MYHVTVDDHGVHGEMKVRESPSYFPFILTIGHSMTDSTTLPDIFIHVMNLFPILIVYVSPIVDIPPS